MKKLIGSILFAAALVFVCNVNVNAASISEVEGNDTIGTAQLLTLSDFGGGSTDIDGLHDFDGDVDYYTFYALAGETVILDIDCGYDCGVDIDTNLLLQDSANITLSSNDDHWPEDPGTFYGYDSYLTYSFSSDGYYSAVVAGYDNFTGAVNSTLDSNSNSGGDYHLLISGVTGATTAPVPEPATIILLGSGLAGLAFFKKRKA